MYIFFISEEIMYINNNSGYFNYSLYIKIYNFAVYLLFRVVLGKFINNNKYYFKKIIIFLYFI